MAALAVPILAATLYPASQAWSRHYLRAHYPGAQAGPGHRIHAFFPVLGQIEAMAAANRDQAYQILVLGSSPVANYANRFDSLLRARVEERLGRPVRVFNLSKPGATSRDAWILYRHLAPYRFDLVLVYQGLNDIRANYCPPALFRDDYGYWHWYDALNLAFARDSSGDPRDLPLAADLWWNAHEPRWLKARRYVPALDPDPIRAYASCDSFAPRLQARRAFRRNLASLGALAAAKGETVVFLPFATWIDPGYSLERFKAGRCDYADTVADIEKYGRMDVVVGGLRAYRAILDSLGAMGNATVTVETAGWLPPGKKWWRDVCHFTPAGTRRFTASLGRAIGRIEAAGPTARARWARPGSRGPAARPG